MPPIALLALALVAAVAPPALAAETAPAPATTEPAAATASEPTAADTADSPGAPEASLETLVPQPKQDPIPKPPADPEWQPKTLAGTGELDHGGYGGLVIRGSRILDQPALFVGGRGGWLIDHCFVIGGGGMGQSLEVEAPPSQQILTQRTTLLDVGYGGFFAGYHLFPKEIVHGFIGGMIGAGGISFNDRSDFDRAQHDSVFVAEPEANVEINLVSFMRLSLGVSYRFVRDVDLPDLGLKDLSGFSYGGSLMFGRF